MKSFSKRDAQYSILIIFFIANIFIWFAVFRSDRQGNLTVAFLDVGQGDAIYIEAPNGNQMLVDGGPSSGALLRALGRVMPFWDRSLDLVLATHPDQDHIGGLPAVFDRMHVGGLATTENTSGTGAYGALEKAISENRTMRILARSGEKIILDGGVVFEILFPDRNTSGWDTNTGSIVARLSYGDSSFLLTGDSPKEIEKYLININTEELHSTVLKLGHHGSRTSSSEEFLSAVDPEYAIISAGENNKYGHPHKEVVGLLSKLDIPALSTASYKTIIFRTNGSDLRIN